MLKALYLYLHTYTHTCIYVSKRQTETPCTGLDPPVWESLFPPQMTSAQGVWDLGWLDQNREHRCLMGSCGRWSGQAVQPANVGVPRVRGGRRSTVAPFENTWGRTREHPGELKGAGTMEEDAKVPQLEDRGYRTAQIWIIISRHRLMWVGNIGTAFTTKSQMENKWKSWVRLH